MADKTGIVMEIKNKKACIMTPGGEFLEVKIKGTVPAIGSAYTSSQVNKIPFYKYAAVAASLVVFISTGGIAYAYYTPTTSVTLDTSLELKLNRWNKIIKTSPLNKTGEKLLNSLNVKNKNINDGLNLLIEKYENKQGKISLDITSEKNKDLDLSNFKDSSKEKKLDVQINYNKSNSTKPHKTDIIEDNGKKVDSLDVKIEKDNSNINSTSPGLPNKDEIKNGVPNNSYNENKINNNSHNKVSNDKDLDNNLKNNSKDELKVNLKNSTEQNKSSKDYPNDKNNKKKINDKEESSKSHKSK